MGLAARFGDGFCRRNLDLSQLPSRLTVPLSQTCCQDVPVVSWRHKSPKCGPCRRRNACFVFSKIDSRLGRALCPHKFAGRPGVTVLRASPRRCGRILLRFLCVVLMYPWYSFIRCRTHPTVQGVADAAAPLSADSPCLWYIDTVDLTGATPTLSGCPPLNFFVFFPALCSSLRFYGRV